MRHASCVMQNFLRSRLFIFYFDFGRQLINLFLLYCREVKKGGIVCMPPFECASGGGGGKSLAFRENEGIPLCRLHLVPSATI